MNKAELTEFLQQANNQIPNSELIKNKAYFVFMFDLQRYEFIFCNDGSILVFVFRICNVTNQIILVCSDFLEPI